MTVVVLYDDLKARRFEPYASTRPVSEMVAGTSLIRERWKIALQPTQGAQFVAHSPHTRRILFGSAQHLNDLGESGIDG